MGRRVLWVVVCSLLAVVLSLPSAALAEVTIKVGHRLDDGEVLWMNWLKEEFERRHPEVTVELIGVGWAPEYVEKLTILWASGEFPDVFYGTRDKRVYVLNGWTKDLTPYFERDKAELNLDDFFPGTVEVWNFNGKQYALPISISGQSMYYNVPKLEEAGLSKPPVDWDSEEWSWTTMREYAQKLTRRSPDGQVTLWGINVAAPLWDYAWTFGGDWLSSDSYETGIPQRAVVDSPENVAAFQAVVDLTWTYGVAPPPDSDIRWPGFWQGQIAMEWVGWWKIRNYIFSEIEFPFGLAPPPKEAARANTFWNDPWFMGSTTQHPDVAWEFIKFASSTEALMKYGEIIGMPPARRSAFDSFLLEVSEHSGMTPAEILQAFVGSVKYGRYTEELVSYFVALGELSEELIYPVLVGETDVRSGLKIIHDQLNVEIERLRATLPVSLP